MRLPRRSLSLSANWRQDSLDLHTGNDEVELFLDKYVFPLEKQYQNENSDDSGLHSLETTSAASSQNVPAEPLYKRAKVKNTRRLVTIVKISGESSTFRTLSTSSRYPEKTLKVARSKTLPSYHKQKLLLTVNGCESNQIF